METAVKHFLFLLLLALATPALAEVDKKADSKTNKKIYAFEDDWNVRVELTRVSAFLPDHERDKLVIMSSSWNGSGLYTDVSYGPIGLYGTIQSFDSQSYLPFDTKLTNEWDIYEAGVFLEYKPFSKSKSTELRGLAFGLNVGSVVAKLTSKLSDEWQEHEFATSAPGAKLGLFARFYTIIDVYFTLKHETSALKVKMDSFGYDEVTQYENTTIGVGYAF